MLQIPFDTSKEGFGANSNRKNGKTSHGTIELYPDFQMPCWLSLDIEVDPVSLDTGLGENQCSRRTGWMAPDRDRSQVKIEVSPGRP